MPTIATESHITVNRRAAILFFSPRLEEQRHLYHQVVTMIPLARHSVLRAARSQLQPTRTLSQSSALARLLSTLAVLEQRNGKLESSSLSAIAAAQKLGGSVTGFLAGSGVKGTSAAEAAKIKGIEKVLAVENDAYEKVQPIRTTRILHIIRNFS
jgi:hypothetical protein